MRKEVKSNINKTKIEKIKKKKKRNNIKHYDGKVSHGHYVSMSMSTSSAL